MAETRNTQFNILASTVNSLLSLEVTSIKKRFLIWKCYFILELNWNLIENTKCYIEYMVHFWRCFWGIFQRLSCRGSVPLCDHIECANAHSRLIKRIVDIWDSNTAVVQCSSFLAWSPLSEWMLPNTKWGNMDSISRKYYLNRSICSNLLGLLDPISSADTPSLSNGGYALPIKANRNHK